MLHQQTEWLSRNLLMTNVTFVVPGGFEPPLTEPKTVVLPLHHRTIVGAKVVHFGLTPKFWCIILWGSPHRTVHPRSIVFQHRTFRCDFCQRTPYGADFPRRLHLQNQDSELTDWQTVTSTLPKGAWLHAKIIIKIYLSENKEVTLLMQLNW